jgi:Skp family chaperone for outer membrane proteins
MRSCHLILAVFLFSSASAQQTPSPPAPSLTPHEIRQLIRKAADNDLVNDKLQRNYTYLQREETHRLDGKGRVTSTEIKTSEIMEIYGEQIERLLSKDDKPLSEKDTRKEEEKIQKLIEKRKNESAEDRKKREEREEKDREEGRKFVTEVADAYNFRLAGIESLEGRATYVIDAEPLPGYKPHMKEAKLLTKIRGRMWIDKDESQLTKFDIQCIDTISYGLFLARIHKGTRIVYQQTRVNDEVWLPQQVALKLDARVALLKEFNIDDNVTYHDYKKFRADTRIVPVGGAAEQ